MKAAMLWMVGAGALLVLSHEAWAQDAPGATPPPAPQVARPAVRHHRRHAVHHLRLAPPVPAPRPAPPETDAGTTPAPVPNEDVGPPRAPTGTSPSLDPGSLHLHYPPLGDGYLPGSSPQDMANTQTPKVPGATYTVPLQSAPPQPLPPPDAGQ